MHSWGVNAEARTLQRNKRRGGHSGDKWHGEGEGKRVIDQWGGGPVREAPPVFVKTRERHG